MLWCICCCSGAGFLLTGCIALIVMIAENPAGFISFVGSILGIAILLPALPYIIGFLSVLILGSVALLVWSINDIIDKRNNKRNELNWKAYKRHAMWGSND